MVLSSVSNFLLTLKTNMEDPRLQVEALERWVALYRANAESFRESRTDSPHPKSRDRGRGPLVGLTRWVGSAAQAAVARRCRHAWVGSRRIHDVNMHALLSTFRLASRFSAGTPSLRDAMPGC